MLEKGLFKGAATALVTPFHEDFTVNYNKLEELVDWQINQGIDALVISGTTGEASTLPDPEHIEVVRVAVKTASGRVPIIAGAGSNDTEHAKALAKSLTSAGADALLCVSPYYNKTNQDGLIKHFEASAYASDLPIILYNVPSRTSMNINPETYYALAKVENILAIKECNIQQVPLTRAMCGESYVHYSGEDGMVLPVLSLGGQGVISVTSNILPKDFTQLCHLWFDEKVNEAQGIQIQLSRLIHVLFSDVSPIPIKVAMNELGFAVGPCRRPLGEISEALAEDIREVLRTMHISAYQGE